MQAEVGSDFPPASDAALSDGATRTPDAAGEAPDGVGPCDAAAPIRLYYWNLHAAASSNDINYIFKVQNATGGALPLASLKVRYYFTNELAPSGVTDVFYTDTCCSNKITNFNGEVVTSVRSLPGNPNGSVYLESAFTTAVGALANGDAVQVELAFHDVGYARNLTQTNDYSYGAAATGTQAQWDDCPGASCDAKFRTCSMTVHRDDILAWGTPP